MTGIENLNNQTIHNNSVLLDEFWPFNGIGNLIYDRSDNSVSKYVIRFGYKRNAGEIWAIVGMLMIWIFSNLIITI